MYEKITSDFISFVEKNPTNFHVVEAIGNQLKDNGFTELKEYEIWSIKKGGKYFVVRNGSSLISFKVPKKDIQGLNIVAAHTDSPGLKIKGTKPEISENAYIKLNVETYGGLLMSTWFDRPLSLAGRITVKEKGKIVDKLVNIDRDLLIIPSLAIHLNRDANKGIEYNPQKHLLPLLGISRDNNNSESSPFLKLLAKESKTKAESILACDIFVYDRTPGSLWGMDGEFFSCKHIDDLQCAYTGYRAFVDAELPKTSMPVLALFDNEEVGSLSKQGADSTFLDDVLSRVAEALGYGRQKLNSIIAGSILVSADNAHAMHPNYPEIHDPINKPIINKGIVIKYAANQKYTTDSVSSALFKEICAIAKVPYQEFYNRSDMAGGGTLGNISNSHVSLNSVDIGLPQLAMHSAYETAGAADTIFLAKALRTFFSKSLILEKGYCFE